MSFTNPNPPDHPRDSLAAYALDAVEGDERQAVESHLALCPSCRRELAVHQEVLSRMIVDERPPETVWDQIVAQTRPAAPPATLDQARHLRDERQARAARPRRRLAGALAAAAAVVAVAGVGTAVVNQMVSDDSPGETELVAESVGVISGDGVDLADVAVDDEGTTYVRFTGASTLSSDSSYQFWSLDSGEPVSLGVLGTGSERVVAVSVPAGTTNVAMSVEPAGGSTRPTTVVGQGELALPT